MHSRLFHLIVALVLAASVLGLAVLIASRITLDRPIESPAFVASSAADCQAHGMVTGLSVCMDRFSL